MPSDLSYWLISAPLKDGDPSVMLEEVQRELPGVAVGGWEIPELKTGTLSALLTLSDNLPKLDAQFTSTVTKCHDTLRSLVSDPRELGQHTRVNDRPAEEYVLPVGPGGVGAGPGGGLWRWDAGRWGTGGKVGEVLEALTTEMTSIDQQQKQRTQSYNLAKGGLTNIQRKRTGNLSQRSLVDVVSKGDLVENSEFLETLLVAVPKNIVKDWEAKYERLTSMVVPRSSQQIAADDDFVLQTVTVFKKVRDEYVHKCRENKFIVRDFKWDDDAYEKQQKELADLEVEEKELWVGLDLIIEGAEEKVVGGAIHAPSELQSFELVAHATSSSAPSTPFYDPALTSQTDLLKLTRINFSESYQLLCHLKTVRLFIESVLRYGLPADYAGVVVRPDASKSGMAAKTLKSLGAHFSYLAGASRAPERARPKAKGGKAGTGADAEVGGEWAGIMEMEYFDFVLFEVPMVVAETK